jgi:hypothetical protein
LAAIPAYRFFVTTPIEISHPNRTPIKLRHYFCETPKGARRALALRLLEQSNNIWRLTRSSLSEKSTLPRTRWKHREGFSAEPFLQFGPPPSAGDVAQRNGDSFLLPHQHHNRYLS